MRKLVSIAALVLAGVVFTGLHCGEKEYFEGEITFVRQADNKDWPADYIIDTFKIYVNADKRMIKRDEKPVIYNLIDANEEMSYSLVNDTIYKQPIKDIAGGTYNLKKSKERMDIAGYKCKKMNADFLYGTDTAKYTFWYTDELELHPKLIKAYKENGNNIYKLIDGVILGIERVRKNGELINKDFAVKVELKQFSDSIFNLPAKPIVTGGIKP